MKRPVVAKNDLRLWEKGAERQGQGAGGWDDRVWDLQCEDRWIGNLTPCPESSIRPQTQRLNSPQFAVVVLAGVPLRSAET